MPLLGCTSDGTAVPTGDAGADGGGDAAVSCPVIATASGPLAGLASGATCTYQGVPFAAPPVGPLRWKPPQPPASWTSPRPSAPASGCPQVASPFGAASTTEDCLYLNVWAPPSALTGKGTSPAPVMVFVPGGAFEWGSGTFELYDGTKLAAATGNIVVTINYRLGALGFLSNPALRAEDPAHPSAGNYAFEDQVAAFQWVKKNAGAFGGDASNVTIFGESAGGTSMFLHLVSPKSRGLFDHVMIESGWAPYGSGALTQAVADANGATLAAALGCKATLAPAALLACLRAASPTDLLDAVTVKGGGVQAPTGVDWLPVVDGFDLPDDPRKLFASGAFTKVPTLIGNNENEGTLFVLLATPTSNTSYVALEEAQWPGQGAAIAEEYPIASFGGSYDAAASAALTDGSFLCAGRRVARAIASAGAPTFRYDFDHAIKFLLPGLGAFHGSELLFVFGNKIETSSLQPDELPLSQAMMGYWGGMAASGNPNGMGRFAWPAYTLGTEPEIVLDLTLSTETELKKAQCDFWDAL
jgi:para-nitrobenzyl esterase